MRRLTLHIGTEKTGTTTLQRFLALNRDRLAAAGIAVPRQLGGDSHRRLPAIANDDAYVDEFFRAEGLGDLAARRAAKARWWQGFAEEVEGAAARRVIVSSEHLHSRLQQDREVARLRGLLDELFDRIDVVLYIREPLQAAVSLFSTAIKAGVVHERMPGPDNPYFNNIANHRASIERWSAAFGAQALTVRVFDRSRFRDGDLIADFLAAADLPQGLAYDRPGVVNETLSHLGLELMSRVNRALPRFLPDGRPDPHRHRLQALFERHFSGGPRFVPPHAVAEAYDAAFAASNEWVRARFFPDAARLFPERPPAEPSRLPLPPEEIDRLTALFVDLWQSRPPRRPGGGPGKGGGGAAGRAPPQGRSGGGAPPRTGGAGG